MHLPLAMQLNALYNLQSLSPGLAIGLESNVWQYAKRWSLVAGLSAEYSSLEQSFFTDIQSGKTKVESNTVQFDFAGAGEVSSSSLRDLWAVRASLGTSYSITPRFSVTAAIQPGLLFSHTRVERLYTSLPQ
ncbi:MAG: hypothetical protein ABIV51_08685, partial [Saprospiraceae bacterium]